MNYYVFNIQKRKAILFPLHLSDSNSIPLCKDIHYVLLLNLFEAKH